MVVDDLWILLNSPIVDPAELAGLARHTANELELDYRTVQLLHEISQVIPELRNDLDFNDLLNSHKRWVELDTSSVGFPSLRDRLVPIMDTNRIRQYLRDLGTQLQTETEIIIGGSCAVSLQGLPFRSTEDLDVVDAVPLEIKSQRKLVSQLAKDYQLKITHFQQHYLPSKWEARIKGLGEFGRLRVYVVDVYDILAGKFFSARPKDKNDLRRLTPLLDQGQIRLHIQECSGMLMDNKLFRNLQNNWYVVYGDKWD